MKSNTKTSDKCKIITQEDIDKLKEAYIDLKEENMYLSKENLRLEERNEVLKKSNLELSKKLETKENK